MSLSVLLGVNRGGTALAQAIAERVPVEFITLYPLLADELRSAGLNATSIDEWSDDALRDRAHAEATERLTKLAEVSQGLFDEQLQDTIHRRMAKNMAEVILMTDLVARCASSRDLRLVLVDENFGRDSRTAILAARRYGIPSLHIPSELPGSDGQCLDALDADRVAVQCDRVRDLLIKRGRDSQSICITGGLDWDTYASPRTAYDREQACATLGLDPDRPVVGYAAPLAHAHNAEAAKNIEAFQNTSRAVIAAFASVAQRHPNCQFILRAHPSDAAGPKELSTWADAMGVAHTTLIDDTDQTFLNSLDTLVCNHGSIGIPALFLGIPVVNVAIEAIGSTLYREDDPIVWARDSHEIAPAIESTLAGKPTIAREADFFITHDGKSLERIAALTVDMIQKWETIAKPIQRYPEFENALARAIPEEHTRIHVEGHADTWVAQCIAAQRENIQWSDKAEAQCIVVADPLEHAPESEQRIQEILDGVAGDTTVIFCAYYGGQFSAQHALHSNQWAPPLPGFVSPHHVSDFSAAGFAVLLHRLGLATTALHGIDSMGRTLDELNENCVGFIAVAKQSVRAPGAFADTVRAARSRSAELCARGEEAFAQGDPMAAAGAFARAAAADKTDPIPHNNLATVMHALGRSEEAYRHAYAALHRDPSLASARENIRIIAAEIGRDAEAERILTLWGGES